MPPLDFSHSFNSPEDADVLLHLCTCASHSASRKRLQQRHDRTYHAHALLLKSCSEYFRACLTSDWQQAQQAGKRHKAQEGAASTSCSDAAAAPAAPATPAPAAAPAAEPSLFETHKRLCKGSERWAGAHAAASSGIRYEVVEHVEAGELDAMEQLLRLMYSHKVPADWSPEMLLQVLRLADRYQAQQCIELMLRRLSFLGVGAISQSTARQLFSMPPGLQQQAAFQSLLNTCKQLIVSEFRDVPAVIGSKELRRQFCALPFGAVLAWVGSDKLQVHSENCVVYLLSAWVQAQERDSGGHAASASQLEQLAQQVRVLQLGPAYQHFVLPKLQWFKERKCMSHLPTLLVHKGVDSWGEPVYPAPSVGGSTNSAWKWEGPAAWVAKRRQMVGTMYEVPMVSLSWELGPEELQQLHAGQRVCSPSTYCNGFQLRISVEAKPGAGACAGAEQRLTLGAFYQAAPLLGCQQDAHAHVPWPDNASVAVNKVVLRLLGPTLLERHERTLKRSRCAQKYKCLGYRDMLSRSAPTVQELVAPLLVDGRLRLEMAASGVDLPL